MAEKIKLIADSIVDLSPEIIKKYDIEIRPHAVNLGDKTYLDTVTVTPDDCFAYHEKTGDLAKTAAASPQEYKELFEKWTSQGYTVIAFAVSSSMSAGYSSIKLACEEVENVYCVDSANLSTGVGLQVLEAADMVAAGKSAKEIVEHLENLVPRVDASFVLDTLHYLWKGGRCSGVAALGANLLKLRPCIEVKGGAMGVGKKYRGKRMPSVLSYVEDRLKGVTDIETKRIFITHSGGFTDEEIAQVKAKINEYQKFDEILVTRAGVTISCHCGPKTLGILYIRKSAKA